MDVKANGVTQVANAPHVPVHLGSMEYAVQYQHNNYGKTLQQGDHLLTNHPLAGGTYVFVERISDKNGWLIVSRHLPDITIISPIFDDTGSTIIFYVASRGVSTA